MAKELVMRMSVAGSTVHRTLDGKGPVESSTIVAEYISPPPEEWRALFYQENGKPEISAQFWSTKYDVERCWDSNSSFMYAIRTDINAKENK